MLNKKAFNKSGKIASLILGIITALNCTGCSFFGISNISFGDNSATEEASEESSQDDKDAEDQDASSEDSESSEEASDNEDEDSDDAQAYVDPIEAAPGEELSKKELESFAELFSTQEYGGLLTHSYETVNDIDWYDVFYLGADIMEDTTDQEQADYYAYTGYSDEVYGVYSFDRATLEAYITKYTGVEFKPGTVPFDGVYLEKYDKYYVQRSEGGGYSYQVTDGKKDGDTYYLRVTRGFDYEADMIYCCKEENGVFMAVSNQTMWEEICSQIIDIDMPQYDGKIQLIVCNDYEVRMIQNRNLLNAFRCDLESISEVECTDINADGRNDIILVGNKDSKEHIRILLDGGKDYYSSTLETLGLTLESELSSYDMDSIKNYLFYYVSENEKSYSIGEAYSQMIFINHFDYSFKYTLVDVNDDGVMELCEDSSSSNSTTINVYTFEDGYIKQIFTYYEYPGSEGFYSDDAYAGLDSETIKGTVGYAEAIYKAQELD